MKRDIINKIIGDMLGEINFFRWSTQWNYADGMKHIRYSVLNEKRKHICYLHHKNNKIEIEGLKNIDHPRFKLLHRFFRSYFYREHGVEETRGASFKELINGRLTRMVKEANKKVNAIKENEECNKKLIREYIIKKFGNTNV